MVVGPDAVLCGAGEADVLKNLLPSSPGTEPLTAAVRACKELIADIAERPIDNALIAQTVQGIADIRTSAEGREGVQAFLQKRKPNWLNAR